MIALLWACGTATPPAVEPQTPDPAPSEVEPEVMQTSPAPKLPPEPTRAELEADCKTDATACLALGEHLSNIDRDAALAAWNTACAADVKRACARQVAQGLETAKSPEEGAVLTARAVELCNGADPLACALWGREQVLGRYIEADPEGGRARLYTACQTGQVPVACEIFR